MPQPGGASPVALRHCPAVAAEALQGAATRTRLGCASQVTRTCWPAARDHCLSLQPACSLCSLPATTHPPHPTPLVSRRATAKVTNVSLRARRGCCVLHRQGTLRLERCSLACEGEGLEHLYACLVTTAQVQVRRLGCRVGRAGAARHAVHAGRVLLNGHDHAPDTIAPCTRHYCTMHQTLLHHAPDTICIAR
jgi:hypothetical protein